jgi:hypothetical protein
VKFDLTVNVGNLITAAGLLIGFIVAHQQNIRKLQEIETRVQLMYDWFRNRVMNGHIWHKDEE